MRATARRLNIALYSIETAYVFNEEKRRLSRAELNIMYALDDGKPHSQAEIVREWLVPKTTVNTVIKRWERLGYVVQKPILGEKREMHILLTESGKEYADSFMKSIYHAEDIALAKTSERYSDKFAEMTEFFAAALREAFEKGDDK